MTINTPARWRPRAAMLAATAALGLAAIPAFASAAPATATLTGPTVYEQQALNKDVTIATNNVHTTVVASPVLPAAQNYLVNMVLDIANIPPGATVLCGFRAAGLTDTGWSSYGHIENDSSGPKDGNCVATGTIGINNSNDHMFAWATVYSGPGGAFVADYSMNEQPVGSVVVTH